MKILDKHITRELKKGGKIRRKIWDASDYIYLSGNTFFEKGGGCPFDFYFDDLHAEDWEVYGMKTIYCNEDIRVCTLKDSGLSKYNIYERKSGNCIGFINHKGYFCPNGAIDINHLKSLNPFLRIEPYIKDNTEVFDESRVNRDASK